MSTPDLLLSFSRDARHFAYKENQNSNLFLYNINRQTKHFVSSPNATCFSFSPDGLFLAFGDNLGNVCIYWRRCDNHNEQFFTIVIWRRLGHKLLSHNPLPIA